MKELLKLVALETLVREVKEHALWRKLYVLPEKKLTQDETGHGKSYTGGKD
jgi:hypothetical protein